jgi:HSP20 family protein
MAHDDPFHDLQREVERMFRNLVYQRNLGSHFGEPAWSPPTDLVVSRDAALVVVELAGVPREDIKVQIEGKTLEISGRRNPPPHDRDDTHYHRAEIWFGEFRRVIELPWAADASQVQAQVRDGMLEVRLVPSPASQHTQITVEHQGS